MGHTPTKRILREAHLRRLVEIRSVSRTLTRLRLQLHPGIRRPGKTKIAERVAIGVPGLLIGIGGIHLQRLLRHIAEHPAGILLIVLSLDGGRREQRTLVGVRHHDHRHIIILPTLIEPILIVADHIAVHAGPEPAEAHIAVAERHRIHRAQLLQRLLLQMLLESQSLLLGTLLRGILADAARGITPGSKRAAALTDTPVEQTPRQRRGTKHAAADRSGALAEDRHLRRIAAEVSDIPLHPLQGIDLVEDAVVA